MVAPMDAVTEITLKPSKDKRNAKFEAITAMQLKMPCH
jgi:hypothetical protein